MLSLRTPLLPRRFCLRLMLMPYAIAAIAAATRHAIAY